MAVSSTGTTGDDSRVYSAGTRNKLEPPNINDVSQSETPTRDDSQSPTDLDRQRGRWIAWDENQESILAYADTYPEIMARVEELRLVNPFVERAPGLHPSVAEKPFEIREGESPDVLNDVRETIADADGWLDTPNTQLGYEKPRTLIGTTQEEQLRDILRGIWSGISS